MPIPRRWGTSARGTCTCEQQNSFVCCSLVQMLDRPNNSLQKVIKQFLSFSTIILFLVNLFLLCCNSMCVRQMYQLTASEFTQCNKRELNLAVAEFG